jgi:hypothetical protein
MGPDELTPFPLSEGQAVLAAEIEALSDEDATEIYAVLVSIVHQMARLDAGLSKPMAVDYIEAFATSCERYIDSLDKVSDGRLSAQYETVRRGFYTSSAAPNLHYGGGQALMVIILGEMMRREAVVENRHDTSGYECAVRMLNWLECAVEPTA